MPVREDLYRRLAQLRAATRGLPFGEPVDDRARAVDRRARDMQALLGVPAGDASARAVTEPKHALRDEALRLALDAWVAGFRQRSPERRLYSHALELLTAAWDAWDAATETATEPATETTEPATEAVTP